MNLQSLQAISKLYRLIFRRKSSIGRGVCVLAANRSHLAEPRPKRVGIARRLSVVVPISVIVVVAIVCIIVAVLTSAQRADEVALDHDKRLFTRSITNHGERILRELESVASPIRRSAASATSFDHDWVQRRVGLWLKNFFDHDFVFVADSRRQPGLCPARPHQRRSALVQLDPSRTCAHHRLCPRPRRRKSRSRHPHFRIRPQRRPTQPTRVALVQQFLGRPAIVAAVLVVPDRTSSAEPSERQTAPIMLTVKFIDEEVLAEIAGRLQLRNLRKAGTEVISPDDHSLRPRRRARQLDRPLCLDAEASRRRDRSKRHSVHRGGARRLRAARRADLRLHAAHHRDHRGQRKQPALSRTA